jgi:hypothetical protein
MVPENPAHLLGGIVLVLRQKTVALLSHNVEYLINDDN